MECDDAKTHGIVLNPECSRGIEEPGVRHVHYGKEGTTTYCLACKAYLRNPEQKRETPYELVLLAL